MQFITSISLTYVLLGAVNAVPTLSERSSAQCPGQTYLTPEIKCPSGFFGCVPYERSSEICNGPKRFFNDCSAAPGLGSFFLCHSGSAVTFIGCTTNSNICASATAPASKPDDPVTPSSTSSNPTSVAGKCPAGTNYISKGKCASGFVGCTGKNSEVCPGPQRFWSTCPPNHGNFYNCANGFIGCTTDTKICG